MTTLDLRYLRQLMGDTWVDSEVFGEKSTHPLGLQQKHDPNSPWVRHAEELLKEIFTNQTIKFDAKVLAAKIKDPYVSTLAEMESAAFLAKQGFAVTLEPSAPDRGPDIRADWERVPYFIEIRAAGFSQEDERVDLISKQIFRKLNAVASHYSAVITIADSYTPNSPQMNAAIAALIEVLGVLKEKQFKGATFYYAHPDGKALKPDGYSYPTGLSTNDTERWFEIVRRGEFVVRLNRREEELTGTPAVLTKTIKLPPEPVNDHERLKKILKNKRKQLPKASRGIITLEVSEQVRLSEFSIGTALYGDWIVKVGPVTGPTQHVETALKSNNRGFFRETSRVSVIVIQKRTVQNGQVKCNRTVYPTNRANADTIRLTLAELQRFGDVEDRGHLSAEHAPNHVDEDDEGENELLGQ